MFHKIQIKNRSYSEWTIVDPDTDVVINPDYPFQPAFHKLFHNDVFSVNTENQEISILFSPVKTQKTIPGILLLETQKTFGRTGNKKHLLYKCIPDDPHLPHFLIPFDIKLGFSKKLKNKYVIFQFKEWHAEHPLGCLQETLGDVDQLNAFYEYQLHCKCVHFSLKKMTDRTCETLKQKTHKEWINEIAENPAFCVQKQQDEYVFTIDPEGSIDFDDAFSIKPYEEGGHHITIYISNVFIWLETLGLWDSFSERVSTIYLPDHKRPMLPAILSDTLCSLQENQSRFALAMDIFVDASGNRIKTPTFRNVLIQVSKNFVYEEPLLLMNESYNVLLRTVKKMDPTIKNSHDVVAYFMVLYNTECATLLEKNQKGIFRATTLLRPDEFQKTQNDTQHLSSDTKRLVYHWNHSFAEYIPFCENNRKESKILQHNYTYTHMTSPIRRLVDIINQMIFSQISHPENRLLVTRFSEKANTFITKTIQNIEYINQSMRSIRKVQIHCHLMNQCLLDPLIMKREHDGVVFHKELKKNKENMFSYMVYVEEYKLLAQIVTDADLPNYSKHSFKIFLFEDENKIMKKIQFELVRKMYTPENPSLNHLA